MVLAWHAPAVSEEVLNLGPLALFQPLLQQLDVAGIIDQHLPPDPQLEFAHGRVLTLLLAARLCQPTALSNIPAWAARTGADLLWDIPADKLNDDRLGRSLDAFFTQRHSILAGVTHRVLETAELGMQRLHFDPTHVTFCGAYDNSAARPPRGQIPRTGNSELPAAHISHGYLSDDKMVQAGMTAVIDELGALPVFCHVLDGNHNGHTAITESFDLLDRHLDLPDRVLFVSDRGTCSVEHIARLKRAGHSVLCAVPWNDYRAVYDAAESSLNWRRASYLSREQQRRRDSGSELPQEHYELAVLRHTLIDPVTKKQFAARLVFVYSSADAAECRQRREQNIVKIRSGLDELVAKLARGHPCTTAESIQKQIARLFGKRDAARYFRWELLPLTVRERAALPAPRKGFRRPTHRLTFTFDSAAAEADSRYDGLSALLTTAPRTSSADLLFTQYKQQNYLERNHHQWKGPIAVRPIFLQSPQRVEALVALLHIALQVHQLLERLYRQRVLADEPPSERRCTADSLVRAFSVCGLVVRRSRIGRLVSATRLTDRQRWILHRLRLATPAQTLARTLPLAPTG